MAADAIRIEAVDTRIEAALGRARRGELLTSEDMCVIWHMSRSTFAAHLARGAFDKFRVVPTIGRPLFSGVLVQKFLNGDPLYVPTFGRKRGVR